MRKNVITIVVFALLLFEGRARVANADDIIMGSGDWCPYVCDPSIHDGANGYLADIAKIIFEDAGHSFTIKYMPFARALSFAREGKITGIPGIYMGDAPDLIFPSAPQGIGINTFYVRRESPWTFKGTDSFSTVTRLGVIRDYYYGDEVHEFIKRFPSKIDILHGNNPQVRSLIKLQRGRIDAWIEDNQVAQYNINRMKLEGEIVPAGTVGNELDVYIAFSPHVENARKYSRLITEGIERLRQSGDLKRILDAYGIGDWENGDR